jgi:hypothetical protein
MKFMRLVLPAAFLMAGLALAPAVGSQDYDSPYPYDDTGNYIPFTMAGLEELVAPVALYPDPLLAQILPAVTFGDQIDEAYRFVSRYGVTQAIDSQEWDVSVKAVAHYPEVLAMLDRKPQWAAALGQAYLNQQDDLMTAAQNLRAQAVADGSLVSTPQQQVITEEQMVSIIPAQPQIIYVPVYNPQIVYVQGPLYGTSFVTFSAGYAIGVWLNRDCDWNTNRVYYHGWWGNRGWVAASRPHVKITNVYVDNRYAVVSVDKRVMQRPTTVYYQATRSTGPVRHDYGRPAAPPPWRAPERGHVTTNTASAPPALSVARSPAPPVPTPGKQSPVPEYRRQAPPTGFGGYGTRNDAEVSRQRGKVSKETAGKPAPAPTQPPVQPAAKQNPGHQKPQDKQSVPESGGVRHEREGGRQ